MRRAVLLVLVVVVLVAVVAFVRIYLLHSGNYPADRSPWSPISRVGPGIHVARGA
jgi:hypothetical protein